MFFCPSLGRADISIPFSLFQILINILQHLMKLNNLAAGWRRQGRWGCLVRLRGADISTLFSLFAATAAAARLLAHHQTRPASTAPPGGHIVTSLAYQTAAYDGAALCSWSSSCSSLDQLFAVNSRVKATKVRRWALTMSACWQVRWASS